MWKILKCCFRVAVLHTVKWGRDVFRQGDQRILETWANLFQISVAKKFGFEVGKSQILKSIFEAKKSIKGIRGLKKLSNFKVGAPVN